jgi:hypothetical protein
MNPALFIACVLIAIAFRDAPFDPAMVGVAAPQSSRESGVFRVLTNGVLPGVYEAAPFTCIVVVPDQNIDPDFVVSPGVVSSAMPVFRPELRLVPRHPSK